MEIITTDSGEKMENDTGWLPGGTLTIVLGRLVGIIDRNTIKKIKKEGSVCLL